MERSRGEPKEQNGPAEERRPISLDWRESAGRDDTLRDTGIALVGKIPWGTHMCLFCQTKADVLRAATQYFAASPGRDEHCVWVVSEPLTVAEAARHLRTTLPKGRGGRRSDTIEVVSDIDWYFTAGRFDWQKTLGNWKQTIASTEAKGLSGIRAFANPWWRRTHAWRDMLEFEQMLEKTIADWPMILLCGYMTETSKPQDVFDVALHHQCAIRLRDGDWDFLEVSQNRQARHELDVLNQDSRTLPEGTRQRLTERERVILAQLVEGASSKQVARSLGISPRTVEFHRANLLRKLEARNAAELIAKAMARG